MNPQPSFTPNRQETPAPSSVTAIYTHPINVGTMSARNVPRHDISNYPTPTGPLHGSASAPSRSSASATPHPSNLYTTTPPNPSVSTPVFHSGRSYHSGMNSVSVPRIPPPPQIPIPPTPVRPNALNFGTVAVDAEDEEEHIHSSDDDALASPDTRYHSLKALFEINRKEMKYIFSASFGLEDVISIDNDPRFCGCCEEKEFQEEVCSARPH